MKPAIGSRLDSWKAIAEYLDRNVRTVTRWAHERGLPVHHVPGGKRGAVFAFAEEIDAWLVNHGNGTAEGSHPTGQNEAEASHGESYKTAGDRAGTIQNKQRAEMAGTSQAWPRASRYWRLVLVAVVVLIASLLVARVLLTAKGPVSEPFSVKFAGDTLEAQDAQGHTIWSHRYEQPFGDVPKSEPFRIADFFGNGNKEIAAIVNLRSGPNSGHEDRREIDFFSGTGRLLWRYDPEESFQFGTHQLRGPWAFLDLLVSESNKRTTLWTAAGHRTWGNSFVAEIDPYNGHGALRFVNTGTLYRLNELKTSTGTFLLAGGFNNEWDGGSLAIMNEDRPFAASPQTPGTRHYCNSCPPGMPDYYFVFPRSEINRVSGLYENPVVNIRVTEDGIEVRKYERRAKGNENTVYLFELRPPFELISLRYDSDYDVLHRAWSAEGKLSHTLENCPERLHPEPVRLWTPSSGWTDVPVKPARANQ